MVTPASRGTFTWIRENQEQTFLFIRRPRQKLCFFWSRMWPEHFLAVWFIPLRFHSVKIASWSKKKSKQNQNVQKSKILLFEAKYCFSKQNSPITKIGHWTFGQLFYLNTMQNKFGTESTKLLRIWILVPLVPVFSSLYAVLRYR
jgi:hypothetical protein